MESNIINVSNKTNITNESNNSDSDIVILDGRKCSKEIYGEVQDKISYLKSINIVPFLFF